MPQIGYSHRPVALGRQGMVASAHPLATLAGIEVLKAGGTAADAAVAVNAVLGVTQPYCCGVGGDFFCLYYESASHRVHFLNGAGRSGSRSSVEELRRRGLRELPKRGEATVSVPGCVRAWSMLLERFGTRRMGDLLAPAIHYAKSGFPITDLVSQSTAEMFPLIEDPEWRRILCPGGKVPRMGDLFEQPDLARTLSAIAEDGPDVFYEGWIAEAIALRLSSEGFVTAEDLTSHSGEWNEPTSVDYRGFRVYETPPPTPGVAVLMTLRLLEGFDLAEMPYQSAEHLHLLIEMAKLAYIDRERWLTESGSSTAAIEKLFSPEHVAHRRSAFDPNKARTVRSAEPTGDTTGFVIADRHGNMISVIQSIFTAFGSGIVPEGTGVILHNRGCYFTTDPLHPNCFGPRKRPFHTLIAALATKDDEPVMGFATMGANGQAQQFHVQVLTNVLDFRLDIQEAIERPRIVIGPPDHPADLLWIERRLPDEILRGLERRGHRMDVVADFFHLMGHSHGVIVRDGTLMGGADPRGDGLALGY